jgi:hypothetical protein
MLENLCFSLKINFGVDVGRVDRNVTQPGADGVDIDSGAKEVGSRRMAAMSLGT